MIENIRVMKNVPVFQCFRINSRPGYFSRPEKTIAVERNNFLGLELEHFKQLC